MNEYKIRKIEVTQLEYDRLERDHVEYRLLKARYDKEFETISSKHERELKKLKEEVARLQGNTTESELLKHYNINKLEKEILSLKQDNRKKEIMLSKKQKEESFNYNLKITKEMIAIFCKTTRLRYKFMRTDYVNVIKKTSQKEIESWFTDIEKTLIHLTSKKVPSKVFSYLCNVNNSRISDMKHELSRKIIDNIEKISNDG